MMVVMVAMGAALFAGGGFAVWWLDRLIKGETDTLQDAAAQQSFKLASVSTELHHARAEVLRVHTQVEALRRELDTFVHGPPSIRPHPQQAS